MPQGLPSALCRMRRASDVIEPRFYCWCKDKELWYLSQHQINGPVDWLGAEEWSEEGVKSKVPKSAEISEQ